MGVERVHYMPANGKDSGQQFLPHGDNTDVVVCQVPSFFPHYTFQEVGDVNGERQDNGNICICPEGMHNKDWCSTRDVIKGLYEVFGEDGVVKASLDRKYGWAFGRDTFISAAFVADAQKIMPQEELWQRAKKAVMKLWDYQREDGKLRSEE